MIIYKHYIGIFRIIENKILLNTIYLIFLTFIFTIILLLFINNNKKIPFLIESLYLEILIWLLPSLIIIFLSIYSIKSSFYVNPLISLYKNIKPLYIEIITTNWNWLIILPKQKIISINEICIPILIPIKCILLSNSIMNTLCIPKVGIQMYCMTNYKKYIYFLLIKHGLMHGLSSNFNGLKNSIMKLTFFCVIKKTFYFWIKKIKNNDILFNIKNYNYLTKPCFVITPKLFIIRKNNIFFFLIKFKK